MKNKFASFRASLPKPIKSRRVPPGKVNTRDFLQAAVDNLEPDDKDYGRFNDMREAVEQYIAEKSKGLTSGDAEIRDRNRTLVAKYWREGDSAAMLKRRITRYTGVELGRSTVWRHMKKMRE